MFSCGANRMVGCGRNRVLAIGVLAGLCGALLATGPLRGDEHGKKPTPPKRAASDEHIRQVLQRVATFDFQETPLAEAVQQIAAEYRIPIVLDKTSIAQTGRSIDTPVTETLRGVPLGLALTRLLEPLGLGYYVEDRSVQIADAHRVQGKLWRQNRPALVTNFSAREKAISAALDDPQGVDIQLVDIPLSEAMSFLADANQITIWIDRTRLEEEGIPVDVPLNIVLSGVTLRSALHLMLGPLGLTAVISDEVLKVTTRTAAEATFATRMYDLADVTDDPTMRDELPTLLRELVAPASWSTPEGAASEAGARRIGAAGLAVTQNLLVHEQIETFLRQVRAITQHDATTAAPAAPSTAHTGPRGSRAASAERPAAH